ncbi:MAG: DUF4276 family protein, partial [Flavobacterium sp.]
DVVFECAGEFETKVEVITINKSGLNFNQQIIEASRFAFDKFGVVFLFVHTDSDASTDELIFRTKIVPAQESLLLQDDMHCKHIVAIVPIQMTESWMLADKNLLKEEIGIEKTDAELGIHLNPEVITNPKSLIENIIRLSKEDLPKRRRNRGLNISDLYQIIGQKIEISELEKLSSYVKFKDSLIDKLRELNYYYR